MTDQAPPVFLKAWPAEEHDQKSLPFLISRILEQKGGFRNVTEQSLEEEIRTGETASREGDDDVSTFEEEEEVEEKPRKEQIRAAKDEIGRFAMQALTDSAHALDFVSLVLSKYAPRQAETSISPFLKQAVPTGSLGTSLTQPCQQIDSKAHDNKKVSAGWKLQSLNRAADSILRSAAKLEKEMNLEARYWEDVLAVKQKGWSVCRYPRERQTLGVRYGFLESPPEFQDRGMAALRRSDEGGINLDLGKTVRTPQALKVSVLQNGQTIAHSRDRNRVSGQQDFVEASILRARDSIFDSELYHEIYREARDLTNRGVKCLTNGIILPLEDDKVILIELTGNDAEQDEEINDEISNIYDGLPRIIATALRILLSHAHRQSYQQRSQLPRVLTDRRPLRPPNSIIRPILSQLQHRAALRDLQSSLRGLQSILVEAEVGLTVEVPVHDVGIEKAIGSLDSTISSYIIQDLVRALFGPLQSSILLKASPRETGIKLVVHTHGLGTKYRIIMISDSSPALSLVNGVNEFTFSTSVDLEKHLRHVLALELVLEIHEKSQGKWIVSSPHEGELTTSEDLGGGHVEMLTLHLGKDLLSVRWNARIGDQTPEVQITWEGSKHSSARKGLLDEIRSFGRLV